jgi:RHS repeat-associated protein
LDYLTNLDNPIQPSLIPISLPACGEGRGGVFPAYDGDDLRAWKTDSGGGATTYYLDDDDGSPIMELNSSGAIQAMNGYGPTGWVARDYPAGSALASTFGAQDYSFTYDPEGNLVQRHPAISDGADALDTSAYDAYGNLIADDNAATGVTEGRIDPVGFGGQYGYYFDKETGKSLLRHRYYDSAYGRFLNRDPIGYSGGINLYGYVGNNPINESDPSGDDPTNVNDDSEYASVLAAERKGWEADTKWKVDWARLQYLRGHPTRLKIKITTDEVVRALNIAANFVDTASPVEKSAGVTFGSAIIMSVIWPNSRVVPTTRGVRIRHNYHDPLDGTPQDHGPTHLHVIGNGPGGRNGIRIGKNGKPLAGDPELSDVQKAVVDDNKYLIRRTVGKLGRILQFLARTAPK